MIKLTQSSVEQMGDLVAIKHFFADSIRPVTMDELKSLSPDDKKELGEQARKALLELMK